MTPIELLNALEAVITEAVKDIALSVRVKGENAQPVSRAAQVYKMRLPDRDSETKLIPYILLQFMTGADVQRRGDRPESVGKVRIIVATYSEDGGVGAWDVLNVLTRIRVTLMKAGVIGGYFILKTDEENPLEYIVYPDDTAPYYLGEMLTAWEMPSITREVNTSWQ